MASSIPRTSSRPLPSSPAPNSGRRRCWAAAPWTRPEALPTAIDYNIEYLTSSSPSRESTPSSCIAQALSARRTRRLLRLAVRFRGGPNLRRARPRRQSDGRSLRGARGRHDDREGEGRGGREEAGGTPARPATPLGQDAVMHQPTWPRQGFRPRLARLRQLQGRPADLRAGSAKADINHYYTAWIDETKASSRKA